MGETELTSGLPEAHQRFLAKYLEAARRSGDITNAKLFTRFPHERLFAGYKDEPKNRAKLLAANSKMPFEIAEHLDVSGCIQVFVIALEKLGEATPDRVFSVVTMDELVRIMDPVELYDFVDEMKWDEQDTPAHRELAGALLREFKTEDLGGSTTRTLHAIEDAIGIGTYVEYLPKNVLAAIIQTARDLADKPPGSIAFTVNAMSEVADHGVLAQHLPIPVLMKPIRAMAEKFGFVKKPESLAPPSTTVASTGDAGDVETKPTIPPAVREADGDDGDPEISLVAAASSAPDDDDAALDALLSGGDANDKDAYDEDDAKTTIGAVVRRPGDPPPLPVPGKGTPSGRRTR
ncbi:MAG: hypothetical protein AAB974_04120 [Patescibacteria group bacterium]